MNLPAAQQQFLTVLDRDEATQRFREHLDLSPLECESVPLAEALGRVLASDLRAPIDVPPFDRSNVDGFAVRAEDTFGASEDQRLRLDVHAQSLQPGALPALTLTPGWSVSVATGAVIPRGATAVLMIEHTEFDAGKLAISRPVAPGANVTWAGTDIGRGETILHRGTLLSSRETGVLAALGCAHVEVVRRPRVAILSTGNEIQPPGETLRPGCVFDSNQTVLADAVRELGGEALCLGVVLDDAEQLRSTLLRALQSADAILLSGGTSKGEGDLSYRVVAELGSPGIVAHGVALKPGKPLCLAVIAIPQRRPVPVVVLPGFPTSAIFTFQEFVAPVLRKLAGRPEQDEVTVQAILPHRVASERGRTEFLLVGLVASPAPDQLPRAVPMGKGSGSVTAFARADGFVTIPRQQEYLEAGEEVEVRLLGAGLQAADLVIMGSHCLGLDRILAPLLQRGFTVKVLSVGSTAGLEAAKRGDCDIAGIHLLDPASNTYNLPFLAPDLEQIPGYGRQQGIVFRPEDERFRGQTIEAALASALADPECVLANRNRGSGTRILIEQLLGNAKPTGWLGEARSHAAVVAAIAQGRADWGLAIEPAAREYGLGFLPLRVEHYDFVVPKSRRNRPAVAAFCEALRSTAVRKELAALGFLLNETAT